MKKLFALLLVVVMVLAMFAACGKTEGNDTESATDTVSDTTPAAPVVATDPFAGKTHAEISDALYEAVLGDFDALYAEAKEADTVAERFVLMAQARLRLSFLSPALCFRPLPRAATTLSPR